MKTIVLCLIASSITLSVSAQSYPVRPVRVVVPVPAGGGNDMLARVLSRGLSERLGRQFIVDNRAGAGGSIGGDIAAKAAPDGYTLIMGYTASHGINPALQKLPYDPVRDFAAISQVASAANMLVVHPSLPVNSVKDLIVYAKANPGVLHYASAGTGSAPHMSGELFDLMAGTKMIQVPYKGSSPALIDVLAGQVELMFTSVPSALPHVKAGKIRSIAVTSLKRASLMPDLPTISESGLTGFDTDQWYGLLGPAKLPQPIVTKLHTETVAILKDEALRKQLINQGFEIVAGTPEQFREHIQNEVSKWRDVVKKAGIKAGNS